MTSFTSLRNIQNLRKSCIKSLEEADREIDVWFPKIVKQRDELQGSIKDLENVSDTFKNDVQKKVTVLNDVHSKFEELLQNEKDTLERLVLEKSDLVTMLRELKEQLDILHKKRNRQCKQVLLLHSIKAQLYKEITATDFLFNTSNVRGTIVHDSLYKVFDLDTKISKEKCLTTHLWALLDEVSCENWTDVIDDM